MAGVRITPLDIERFTCGDCDVLAHVLNQLTGWPVYSLHWGDRDDDVGLHAFVLAPGKVAVDIEGARHVSKLVRRWSEGGARGYVRGCWSTPHTHEAYPGSWRRARKVAPHLAAQVG